MKLGKKAKIAVVAVIAVVGFLFYALVLPLITESPPAVLIVDSGDVQVAQSPLRQASGSTQLKEGDQAVTGKGKASVVLFGSSVVRLEENTTISLAELKAQKGDRKVKLKQDSGRIWNKVIKLSGVDNYQIETPTSVATIRGTGFDSWIKDDFTSVSVVEGTVNVVEKQSGQSTDLNANQATDVTAGLPPAVRALVEDDWIRGNKQLDEQFLLELREKIKAKYWIYLLLAKSQYKLTDQQVNEYIDAALSGRFGDQQIRAGLDQLGIEIKV